MLEAETSARRPARELEKYRRTGVSGAWGLGRAVGRQGRRAGWGKRTEDVGQVAGPLHGTAIP